MFLSATFFAELPNKITFLLLKIIFLDFGSVKICEPPSLLAVYRKCLKGTAEIDPQTVHQSVLPHWMQLVHTINFHPLSPIPRLRSGVRVQNGNKRISQKPNGPLFVAATTTNKATCSFFFVVLASGPAPPHLLGAPTINSIPRGGELQKNASSRCTRNRSTRIKLPYKHRQTFVVPFRFQFPFVPD